MLTVSSTCLQCGLCAEDCPVRAIVMEEDGPRLLAQKCLGSSFFACGHCVAVCPQGALDHPLAPLANQAPVGGFPVLDPATAARFLRSRRSIRCYKPDTVPRQTLLQLLEIARFAPTGCNSQGVSYVVVARRELMRELTEVTAQWLEEHIANNAPWAVPLRGFVEEYRNTGKDTILYDAPHMIVATAPRDFPFGRDNAHFSLAYLELFASSLGLGTCWSGLVEHCGFCNHPELYRLLGIKDGMVIVGAVMVGYPRHTYQKLVDRNPLAVTWLE